MLKPDAAHRPMLEFLLEEQAERDGYWYLATPYSLYPGGLDAAANEAARFAGYLIKHGVRVFSPIAHSHAIAKAAGIDPVDLDLWIEADKPFMPPAIGLIVGCIEGWEDSKGVEQEIGIFHEAGKLVIYMEPPPVPSRKETSFRDNETILDEAARLTSGDRQRDYDHPLPNHERIARLWQAYLDGRKGGPLTPVDAAWMMLLVKVARDQATPKRDNATDAAGYARCIERIRAAQGLPDYAA